MKTDKATARPWKVGGSIGDYKLIENQERIIIAKMPQKELANYNVIEEENANAELIVRAVNNYEALLEACKSALSNIEYAKKLKLFDGLPFGDYQALTNTEFLTNAINQATK